MTPKHASEYFKKKGKRETHVKPCHAQNTKNGKDGRKDKLYLNNTYFMPKLCCFFIMPLLEFLKVTFSQLKIAPPFFNVNIKTLFLRVCRKKSVNFILLVVM